jgi:hypothetical protein
MNWSDFYLVCFLVGFGLSLLSLLAGSVHFHIPHLHLHHGGAPWFNVATIAAFLAWFGGTGYLLERYYGVWYVLALGIAALSGIGAAALVFWFLAKVLLAREAPEHTNSRGRHGRAGLFPGRHAPGIGRAQREWRGHP